MQEVLLKNSFFGGMAGFCPLRRAFMGRIEPPPSQGEKTGVLHYEAIII